MPFKELPLGLGLYTAADARAVPKGMAQALNNAMIDRDPAGRAVGVQVRRGSTTYATGGSGIITGGVEYPTSVSTSTLLWSKGNVLLEGTTGTVVHTSAIGGGNPWEFLPMRDPDDGQFKVYCVLGHDLSVWNGGTMTLLSGAGNVYEPDTSADPPEEANLLADEDDDIHLASVIGTAWGALALGYKDRVYFSHPLRYDYFPVNSYWDLVSDKGDSIMSIHSASQGTILVGKEKSLFAIRGTDFENSILETVTLQLGVVAKRTSKGAEELGGVIFQGNDAHVYLYQTGSSEPVCLSREIESTIREIDPSLCFFNNALVWDRKYWLRTSTGASAFPNLMLVYDFTTRQWEYHDDLPGGFTAFIYDRRPLLGTTDGTLRQIDTGTTDNGTAINGEYRTGAIAPAGPSVKHLFQTVFLTASGSGTLTVTITVDGTTRTRLVSLSSEMEEYRLQVNAAGKWIDVKVAGPSWHVLGPATVEYTVLDVGRRS